MADACDRYAEASTAGRKDSWPDGLAYLGEEHGRTLNKKNEL